MAEYGEFACSRETADWLIGGGMTKLDGRPVRVRIAEECTAGNVICQVEFVEATGRTDIHLADGVWYLSTRAGSSTVTVAGGVRQAA